MGNLGFGEILAIAIIALLVFGPERLPEFARQAGRLVARVREETSRGLAELRQVAEIDELDRELTAMRDEIGQVGRELTAGTRSGKDRGPGRDAVPRVRDTPPPTDPDAT